MQLPSDYQRRFVRFKSALTRAERSKDPNKVIAACDAFFNYYERSDTEPFPDAWSRWERARDDARYALARLKGSW